MAKKPRRSSPSLERKRGTRTLAPLHWVFCEGKTEKDCIEKLRREHRLSGVHVTVVGQVGVPSTIVAKAGGKKREISRSTSRRLPSHIHVVFDRDEHPCFHAAVDRARANEFSLGISVPCIELWAILLHQDQTAAIRRLDAQKLLKALHPKYYHKTNPVFDAGVVVRSRGLAAERVTNLATRAANAENEFANPSTTFHLVLAAIFDEG